MAAPIRTLSPGPASRTILELFLNLEGSQPDDLGAPPGLIVVLPPVWANKYQVLLYGEAARRRFAVLGVTGPADLAQVFWPGPIVLHAHWFASIFKSTTSEAEASALLDVACDAILHFRNRTGAKLIWTAHNVFPHGNAFPDAFLRLRRWLFRTMDAVHVMESSHVALLEAAYDTPAPQTFVVPHMLYSGSLIDAVERVAARAHLGISSDAFTFGFFGAIQRYKRVDLFLDAFDRLAQTCAQPLAAIVAGHVGDPDLGRELAVRCGADPRIRLLPRQIADNEIQHIFRAADAMVLPYTEMLNSGAAMMAATFRTPFIAPEAASAPNRADLGGLTYDPDAPDGLMAAMAACIDGSAPAQYDDARLATLAPARVSGRFFDAVDRIIAGGRVSSDEPERSARVG